MLVWLHVIREVSGEYEVTLTITRNCRNKPKNIHGTRWGGVDEICVYPLIQRENIISVDSRITGKKRQVESQPNRFRTGGRAECYYGAAFAIIRFRCVARVIVDPIR